MYVNSVIKYKPNDLKGTTKVIKMYKEINDVDNRLQDPMNEYEIAAIKW